MKYTLHQHQAHRVRAFTLVETIISIVLVSVLLVAALTAAGASARFRQSTTSRDFASLLASDLTEEMAGKLYGGTTSGSILTTALAGNRSTTTNIDQYNGLTESPPVTWAGTAVSGATGWSRSTVVERVLAKSPDTTTTDETGVKRVTITVSKGSTVFAKVRFIRTYAWDTSRN
jgi:prepilin-type N-terminal cleavage/methylation domain-containing protein